MTLPAKRAHDAAQAVLCFAMGLVDQVLQRVAIHERSAAACSDDDVVARQLREAAMREPDPAIREKLWDEYRKYKGIDS